MNPRLTPIALAALAFTGAAHAAPTISWTAPASGAALTGTLSGTACQVSVNGNGTGISRVKFYVDSEEIATDNSAPYQCTLDTRRYAAGAHTLRAVVIDWTGATASATRSVTFGAATTPPPAPASAPAPAPAPAPTPSVSTPPPGSGALDVWFKAPLNGSTVSGILSGTRCYVAGSGIARVEFRADSTVIGSDTTMSDGMQCTLDTTRLANGNHTMTARAYASNGTFRDDVITVNVQNAATTPANAQPSVSLTAPANTNVSGTITYAATASDDKAVARVVFAINGTTIATDTAAPYTGTLNTTTLPNGTHTLTATAHDAEGLTRTSTMTLNVQNSTNTNTSTPPTSSLPSTNTQAIPTFESIGMYWRPGTNPGTAGCTIRYRKTTDTAWKEGLPMWYDSRNAECRGSLVHLTPNTDYEVQMGYGGTFRAGRVVKTWAEQFPVARTVTIPAGAAQYNITEGGTPNGYVVYTGTTLDAGNNANYNILVSAPYVIIRGMTLRGARIDAIRLNPGAHDVVIERNNISGWGRQRTTPNGSWAVDNDAGVRAICSSAWRAERIIIQDNRIHSPRHNSNTWDLDHPAGAQAIAFHECGGNHVFRYNEITSDNGNYFNDAIGGSENYSSYGFPNADTDIYGNKVSHAYDDGIESEGANRNVRIWGNYIDQTGIGIASTATHVGPLYIFRNVQDRSRFLYNRPLDQDDRPPFAKSGQNSGYGGGRRYFFHNTTLQRTQAGVTRGLGVGYGAKGNTGQPLTNSVGRNNIWHLWTTGGTAVADMGGTGNDFDYDMTNGGFSLSGTQEAHRIISVPTYAAGNGPGSAGMFQLAPGSRGYDQGVRVPNFNDSFTGAAPDVGAHEGGTPAMKFGVR